MRTFIAAAILTLSATAALAAQAPVFEHDYSSGDNGNRTYTYTGHAPAAGATPLIEGRQALTTGWSVQPVFEQDNSTGDNSTRWYVYQ